jgi:hypothetical protein
MSAPLSLMHWVLTLLLLPFRPMHCCLDVLLLNRELCRMKQLPSECKHQTTIQDMLCC